MLGPLPAEGADPALTRPGLDAWPSTSRSGLRRAEISALIGRGERTWARATRDVLRWRVKTASGFDVPDSDAVTPGIRLIITARVLGVRIQEPVEVVSVIEQPDRVGFAYRTLPGHPITGEEAFIVHRREGDVFLTVRSLTGAASRQPWRMLFPLLLIAQKVARRRYLRALRDPTM